MALDSGRARIYLSFADEDRPRVMELARWLNDSGWQVRADDRHAFEAGEDWGRAAAKRLNSCDVILCVITPGWLVSAYCHREYSYCAKRGKFVLPVMCELTDVELLPEAMRPLPRVDLTQGRMVDYLALKEVLTQAGTQIDRAAIADTDEPRQTELHKTWAPHVLRGRRYSWLWLVLAAVAAALGAAIWLWWRSSGYSSL
jgi:TIR domain-containing protein